MLLRTVPSRGWKEAGNAVICPFCERTVLVTHDGFIQTHYNRARMGQRNMSISCWGSRLHTDEPLHAAKLKCEAEIATAELEISWYTSTRVGESTNAIMEPIYMMALEYARDQLAKIERFIAEVRS